MRVSAAKPINTVTVKISDQIKNEHSLALESRDHAVAHAVRAGELLAEAKAQVPHGEWLAWVEQNCGFAERTARAYIQLASNRQRVADLPVRQALKALAEPKPQRRCKNCNAQMKATDVHANCRFCRGESRLGDTAGSEAVPRCSARLKAPVEPDSAEAMEGGDRIHGLFTQLEEEIAELRKGGWTDVAMMTVVERLKRLIDLAAGN